MNSEISNSKFKILIAGAGPAGASLAIRLAQKGVSVALVEREKFPRQKLCGEFISPECFEHFKELGVLDEMLTAGGDSIKETRFYAENGKSVTVPSNWFSPAGAALGLSRAEMDFRLLGRARNCGVEIFEETQIAGLLFDGEKVSGVKAKNKAGETFKIVADLTVDATGRSAVLASLAKKFKVQSSKLKGEDKEIQNPKSKSQNRLVGFKAHLRNARVAPGACEIYFFPGGYGGLSSVENNLANHCFLIRADLVKKYNSDAQSIVEKVVFQNERARATLKNAAPVHDWLAVSVEGFGLKDLNPAPNLLSIGDAAAFIDPFTGSGMLMALESARLLTHAILESSSIEQTAENYKILHARAFRQRLFVCRLMRRAAFAPRLAGWLVSALSLGSAPRRLLARATRRSVLTGGG